MRYEEGRISSQHEQLNTLFREVLGFLDRGAVHIARQAFARFSDALQAHFALEDELYFPALHGLRADLGPSIAELVAEHRGLRCRLTEIGALLGAGEGATSHERLRELAGLIADHEKREEALIATINAPKHPN
jgi:hemerythrin